MRDIHAHILPGIDDGAPGWEAAVGMLKAAVDDGITEIAATPHVTPGLYENPAGRVAALVSELEKRAEGLSIKIYPGSEIAVSAEALAGLKEKRYLTLNSGRYALIEPPAHFTPKTLYDFISEIKSLGLVPVIAHPERNPRILDGFEILYELAGLGAFMQVTAGSLTGLFGSTVRRFALDMLERRLVHVLASDAHNLKSRKPVLSLAAAEAAKIVGEEGARALVSGNPGRILKSEPFAVDEPLRLKKPLFFFHDLPSADY